jgi:hypothetical protein
LDNGVDEILKDFHARHEHVNSADDDLEELRVKIAAIEDEEICASSA